MNQLTKIIFNLILFFVFSLGLGAQEETPFHSIFTTEDGLPSNRVYDIMQDSRGYLWAATDNGVVRFNGREFKEYTTVESVHSEYTYLHELKDGSIWCMNFGNQILRVSGDSLKVVEAFLPYINDTKYFKFHQWRDSILYLENSDRVIEYDVFNDRIREIRTNNDMISNFCRDEGSIYYRSRNYSSTKKDFIISLEDQSVSVPEYEYPTWLRIHHSNGFSFLFAAVGKENDSSGYLFPFSPSNPYPLDKCKSILTTEKAFLNMISSITYVDKDNIWVSTTNGSFHIPAETCLFPNNFITRVIRDMEGNHWVSTYHSGIFFVPNLELKYSGLFPSGINQIENISDSELILSSLDGHAYIYDIRERKIRKSMFISKPSTHRLPLLNDNKALFVHSPKSTSLLNLQNNQSSELKSGRTLIKNFSLMHKDVILIQSAKNNLAIYNTNKSLDKSELPIMPLSDQWLPTDVPGNDWKNSNFYTFRLDDTSHNVENIYYEKKEKRIWIAHTNKTSTEQNQMLRDFHDGTDKNLKLNCFADHMDEGIIAAERTHGLIFIRGDRITSRTKHSVYKEFGNIRDIITTDSLIICLAKKGIIIADKNGIPLHTLDETDGLKGSIINDIQCNSGMLWMGTSKGLYSIPIDAFRDNMRKTEINISHILVNNKRLNPPLPNRLRLSNNADVEINYEVDCFKGRNAFHYQYKLRQDEEWKTISSSSPSIRFPNLSSGNYKFKIRAINEEGVVGEIAAVDFRVLPPYWLRWWFILGAVVLIGTGLFFYNKRNLERIARENQLEKERIERENQLEQEIRANKLSALQSRMNPHFIFNSLNSIQDFIIKLDKVGANEYLGIFSDLMRIYLSHSELDNIEIQEEIESLQLYLKLEELRFSDIDVDFRVDDELRDMDIHLPPLFIQPYIENAFKHGLLHKSEDKKLIIAFRLAGKQLIIHIEDNGVGRAKVQEIQNKTSAKGLSYATKANQTRLELLNHNRTEIIRVDTMDLYVNGKASGTLVEISIPLLD